MRKLTFPCIVLACGALLVTGPAAAQKSKKKTKQQAFTECQTEVGRGVTPSARQQEMQACIKAKMQGRR
jgi:hypothetical protein